MFVTLVIVELFGSPVMRNVSVRCVSAFSADFSFSTKTVKGAALVFQACTSQFARTTGKAFQKGATYPHSEVGQIMFCMRYNNKVSCPTGTSGHATEHYTNSLPTFRGNFIDEANVIVQHYWTTSGLNTGNA